MDNLVAKVSTSQMEEEVSADLSAWKHEVTGNKPSELAEMMSNSFPALCQLFDKVASLLPENLDQALDSSAVKAIAELNQMMPKLEKGKKDDTAFPVPVFNFEEKFEKEDTQIDVQRLNSENISKAKDLKKPILQPNPRFCLISAHHHYETKNENLLQICCGEYRNINRTVDNSVRELDAVIRNPQNNLCSDAMETSWEFKLPGPHSYSTPCRQVYLNLNRNCLDVLGLFMLLIDTIYATRSLEYERYKGGIVPLRFTHSIVKIISVIRVGFPDLFGELQKITMYSTLVSVMKKHPFNWHLGLIHVLEDAIIHPLNFVDEKAVEFNLLQMILRKRAKVLIRKFSDSGESHIFDSLRHEEVMKRNFTPLHRDEIRMFLRTSADNCKQGHRIKNVRYRVKDVSFESKLRDLFLSYC